MVRVVNTGVETEVSWDPSPNMYMEYVAGIDFDGEYLWVCPMGYKLLKMEIDWEESQALEPSSWGSIKTSF